MTTYQSEAQPISDVDIQKTRGDKADGEEDPDGRDWASVCGGDVSKRGIKGGHTFKVVDLSLDQLLVVVTRSNLHYSMSAAKAVTGLAKHRSIQPGT
jgi:hypothetical protein